MKDQATYPCHQKEKSQWCDRLGLGGFMGHTCIAPKPEAKAEHDYWRGIGKLIEEMGELNQLLGKLIPFPDGLHPDGKGELAPRIKEEMADLYAALDYFREENFKHKDAVEIAARRDKKHQQFKKWGLTGIPLSSINRRDNGRD